MKVDVTVRVSPQHANEIVNLAWLLDEPDSISPWWTRVVESMHFWLEHLMIESARFENDPEAFGELVSLLTMAGSSVNWDEEE